jgi:hypothetical protein
VGGREREIGQRRETVCGGERGTEKRGQRSRERYRGERDCVWERGILRNKDRDGERERERHCVLGERDMDKQGVEEKVIETALVRERDRQKN